MRHSLNRLRCCAITLASSVILSGCTAPQTVRIHLPVTAIGKASSNLHISAARDQQEYKNNQGVLDGDTEIQVTNPTQWLYSNVVQAAQRLPCKLRQSLDVTIDLENMYVGSNGPDMTGAVIIKAVFRRNHRLIATHHYRGQCSRIPWGTRQQEASNCFNEALDNALLQMKADACAVR